MIFLSPCRFQSTFPRGERHLCWLVAVKHIHFNPRSLVGNDYIPVGTYTIVEISIHVPSWGTTQCLANTRRMRLFQSTFPRGERRRRWICSTEEGNFNPRSLVGNDRRLRQDIRLLGISIHVPSWGTTRFYATVVENNVISIHVPSWGTTANFHKYSLFFYAINIIFLLFIIPSLFSLVLFMLLF